MIDTDSNKSIDSDEFCWSSSDAPESQSYLAPSVLAELSELARINNGTLKILDLGCGNGSFSQKMISCGYHVVACDHSNSGIQIAKEQFPQVEFFQQDINEPIPKKFLGTFDVVVSLEVIEHLFQPRTLFDRAKEALGNDGYLIISAPYHGYFKNLALALFNKFDSHWHPLRDFGHIKFFSKSTLIQCVTECGFQVSSFKRVGRVPVLAKSMIVKAVL